MSQILDWSYLKCECGGDLFSPLVKMKYKQDGGTVMEPAGHRCMACNAVVDNRYMAQLIDLDRKRKQIRELQAEVGEAPEPPKVTTPK